MSTIDLAKVPPELLAEARRRAAAKGQAMSDGSYPTTNRDLFDKAVRAVGRGTHASHNKIRRYLIGRGKAEGWPVPDDWNADGSLKTDMAVDTAALLRMGRVIELADGRRVLTIDLGKPDPRSNREGLPTNVDPRTAGKGTKTRPGVGLPASDPDAGTTSAHGRPGQGLPASTVSGKDYPDGTINSGQPGSVTDFAPEGTELHDVTTRLRAVDALRTRGHKVQADRLEAALVREKTSRARKMRDGKVRAHTADEVKRGLDLIRRGRK